jgi:hypothetical protein
MWVFINLRLGGTSTLLVARVISYTVKIDATRSSETSVYNKPTRSHIPEDVILHVHCRENLKFFIMQFSLRGRMKDKGKIFPVLS